jgi:hypothetical protein
MRYCTNLFLLLIFLLFPAFVIAQESRGTISGAVTDPSGAAIPSAKITVSEIRTGINTPTVTDSVGHYTIPFLPPGDYEIRVEGQGYRPFVRSGVHLASGDHPVIDAQLQIGATTEAVTVTGDAPLIDTANASTGQTITTKQIEDFPLNGRNPMMAVQLAIGVIATANPTLVHPFDNGAASAWSIGGTPSQTAEIMMDGAPNATWDNRMAYAPPQEAVQEVKVKAFDTDASYGHTGSGTINKVMKTGTNQFHGSGYEFMQPSALAANNFFNNRAGVPVPETKLNQYGLTAGGPVILPKLYNGRNKLFWFFAWEVLKDSQPNSKFLTVPTDAERQGDFSALLGLPDGPDCITGANGKQKTGFNCYQVFNPYSGTGTSTITRKAFMCDAGGNPLTPNAQGIQASGTPCNKIPQQLLNPVALAYLKFYPAANVAGKPTGYSNFANSATTDDDYDNEIGRMDWAMSERSRLSFNFRHNYQLQSKNNYFGNNAHGIASNLRRINWGSTVDEVYTLNNTTVIDVRANYTRMNESHPSPMAGFDATTLGFPSYLSGNSQFRQLPQIVFGNCGSDTTQATSFDCLGQTGADLLPSESYSLFGNVSKQWNKHTLKFGADVRRYKLDAQTFGASVGSFTFGSFGTTNGWTQAASNLSPAPFGQDFASFLLGLPSSGSYNLSARGTYTENYYALFLNDDWRIRSNLTLNLGLRFDRDLPYTEKLGRTVNGFDFTAKNPLADAAIAAYNSKTASQMNALGFPLNFAVPGGLTFASPSNPSLWENTSHLFSPRVGFAWTPEAYHQKTVIRGGFGLFVQPIALSNLNPTGAYSSTPILTQEGFNQTSPLQVPGNFSLPIVTLSNPFPNGFIQPPGASAGLTTFLDQNVDFFNSKAKNPYSERWTFGIQQELTPNLLMEIAYIGNHAVHLPVSVTQLNGIPRQYLSTLPYRDAALITKLNTSVPNPFAGLVPSLGSGGLNGTTIQARRLLVPFPQFPAADSTSFSSGVTERNLNVGSSNFNSLNVRVEKRLSNGIQVVATYAWSKLIEQDEFLNNTDPAPERRISPFDHTHRFIAAVNYDLPVGRGKLLNIESRWLDAVVGGWRLNGIYTYQTGAPILFMNGSSNNPGDYAFCSVSTVTGACPTDSNGIPQAAVFLPSSLNLDSRRVDGTAFDTSRFVTASSGLFSFHLRTLPTTFSNLRLDGQNNFDASVLKKFDITERMYFQFRMEAFNLLNHPVFASPNMQVTSGTQFGTITSTANRPRQLQIGLRFVF